MRGTPSPATPWFFHFKARDQCEIFLFLSNMVVFCFFFSNMAVSFTHVTMLVLLMSLLLCDYNYLLFLPLMAIRVKFGHDKHCPCDPTRIHTGTWTLNFTRMSRAVSKAAAVMYISTNQLHRLTNTWYHQLYKLSQTGVKKTRISSCAHNTKRGKANSRRENQSQSKEFKHGKDTVLFDSLANVA